MVRERLKGLFMEAKTLRQIRGAKDLAEEAIDAAALALNEVQRTMTRLPYGLLAGIKPIAVPVRAVEQVLEQQKSYDEALKALDGAVPESFAGLVADRRGDIYAAQARSQEAVAQYQAAYKALDKNLDYRHLVEFKLNALGAKPEAVAQAPATNKTTVEN